MNELKLRGKPTRACRASKWEDVAKYCGSDRTAFSHGQNVNLADAMRQNSVFAGFGVLLAPKNDPQQTASCRQIDVFRENFLF